MKHREERRKKKRNQDRAILYDLAKVQTKKEMTLNSANTSNMSKRWCSQHMVPQDTA